MRRTLIILAVLAGIGCTVPATAQADPAGDAVCRLLAFGSTPETVADSVTVHQVLGPDATSADRRLYVRSVVAGQCPQYLWRF